MTKVVWARFSPNGTFHAVVNKQVACNRYEHKDRTCNRPTALDSLVAAPLNPDMKCRACEDVLIGIMSERDPLVFYARALRKGIRFEEKRKSMWLDKQVARVLREFDPLLARMFPSVNDLELWAPGLDGLYPPGDVLMIVTAPPGHPECGGGDTLEIAIAKLYTPSPDESGQPDHGTLESMNGQLIANFQDGREFRRVLCQLLAQGNTARLLFELVDKYKQERRAAFKEMRAKTKRKTKACRHERNS
jgi:hypothetical protein